MKPFALSVFTFSCLLSFHTQVQAEGFRSGTIYVQPAIAETIDDTPELRQRIATDLAFAKQIYSQVGITVKASETIVLNQTVSERVSSEKQGRVTVLDDLWKLKLPAFKHEGRNTIPLIYVPPVTPLVEGNPQKFATWNAVRGNTPPSLGSFISIWLPKSLLQSNAISHDTAAHEMLHFLLGEQHSFEEHAYSHKNRGHSNRKSDLMYPGGGFLRGRRFPETLEQAAPTGNLSQIRNTEMRINGTQRKLYDVLFEDNPYVYVETDSNARMSLHSSRMLWQYPAFLPEPPFLMKSYDENLDAEGSLEIGKVAEGESASETPIPILLEYVDRTQKHFNENGTVFGGTVERRDPVVWKRQVSQVSASIEFVEMSNFRNGRAEATLRVRVGFAKPPFARTQPLRKSAIDRTARAMENTGRHVLKLKFDELKLGFGETLSDYGVAYHASGKLDNGIEYSVSRDPQEHDGMLIEMDVPQGVGRNNPELREVELETPLNFWLVQFPTPEPAPTPASR
ncbi:MAG: hypothetical protein AAFX06_02160 [Planctomycetota bacterium]